ncbi:TraR/DksA C4-type zinc finger protein [Opitutales bacterium ASA1]|uniref:TraR/DksA family transcriptional regulator n=1 Tax=Congregicoccus parvus TaxID=3081749 RepID=UPI002B2FF491|nr:TraR/DksA C4-type zinc finger protein [Opitutales bacterium ASA1]
MLPEDQQRFRPVIAARLAALDVELHALDDECRAVSPDVSIGRLSRLDAMQHQQMALAGKRRLEEERARLHEAERRILQGTFGRCLLCGKDIAELRLEHQPDAVTCVPCMSRKK